MRLLTRSSTFLLEIIGKIRIAINHHSQSREIFWGISLVNGNSKSAEWGQRVSVSVDDNPCDLFSKSTERLPEKFSSWAEGNQNKADGMFLNEWEDGGTLLWPLQNAQRGMDKPNSGRNRLILFISSATTSSCSHKKGERRDERQKKLDNKRESQSL